MKLLLRWAILTAALYLTVWGLSFFNLAEQGTGGWSSWFVAVIIMALVNALIRPIAALLLAPLNCLTFGIVGVLLNAVMFALVPAILQGLGMPVFSITPVGALIGSLAVPAIDGVLSGMLLKDDESK